MKAESAIPPRVLHLGPSQLGALLNNADLRATYGVTREQVEQVIASRNRVPGPSSSTPPVPLSTTLAATS